MNGVLTALAIMASNTAPADPLTTSLGTLASVVVGAAIGYLFGLLRDANKTKAEREARHQDAVLEAASALLVLCNDAAKASAKFQTGAGARGTLPEDADANPELSALGKTAEEEAVDAYRALTAKMREAQPHRLKLRILAPSLTDVVTRLIETANSVVRYGPSTGGPTNLSMADYKTVADEFTSKVQDFLNVKQPRTKKGKQGGSRRPLYGLMSDDYAG